MKEKKAYISLQVEDNYEKSEKKNAQKRAETVAEEQLGQMFRSVHATNIPLWKIFISLNLSKKKITVTFEKFLYFIEFVEKNCANKSLKEDKRHHQVQQGKLGLLVQSPFILIVMFEKIVNLATNKNQDNKA